MYPACFLTMGDGVLPPNQKGFIRTASPITLALLLPPVAVLLQKRFGKPFFYQCGFMSFGYIPSVVHAFNLFGKNSKI
jgi:uncharacterized membrane protein YqaE (UPF0057 family)